MSTLLENTPETAVSTDSGFAAATLVGSSILLAAGSVQMSKSDGGWRPLVNGDLIAPFLSFPAPAEGTRRSYRVKACAYDENAAAACHLEIRFATLEGGDGPVFRLPQIASAMTAFRFVHSDWVTFGDGSAAEIYTGHARVQVRFVSNAPYDNHAGVYSAVLEAYDVRA